MRVPKGFMSQAYKVCTGKYLQSEIDFLNDTFTENVHSKSTLTRKDTLTYDTSIS